MIATENKALANGDIIELISYDENCKRNIRRVRVQGLTERTRGRVRIVGVNMKRKHPKTYVVGAYPSETLVPRANANDWVYFDDSEPADV